MDITGGYVYLGYGSLATSAAPPLSMSFVLILAGVFLIIMATRRGKNG